MGFGMITSRGVTYLTSELVDRIQGVRHGFSTRVGGISPAPWNSLNLGFASGDEDERVRGNWKRFLDSTGIGQKPLVHLSQVHSATALTVVKTPEKPFNNHGEADALVSELPNVALAVLAADCLPIVIVGGSPARIVGAVHSGWRGVVKQAAQKTIERMVALCDEEVSPGDFTVAIGPHIRQCCFEVGPEVVADFRKAGELADGEVKPGDGDRSYLDLAAITMRQLVALGVGPERIEAVRHCTRCRPDLFFSYRGEGPNRGMQGATVALEA